MNPESDHPPYSYDLLVNDTRWMAEIAAEDVIDRVLPLVFEHASIPAQLDGKTADISIVLSSDAEVRDLNRDYRGKDAPTNVLSFATLDDEDCEILLELDGPFPLGDAIMAFETVQREAADQGKPFGDHFAHLLVHGLLHLLGYDHIEEEDAQEMEALERQILAAMDIPDPYRGA